MQNMKAPETGLFFVLPVSGTLQKPDLPEDVPHHNAGANSNIK